LLHVVEQLDVGAQRCQRAKQESLLSLFAQRSRQRLGPFHEEPNGKDDDNHHHYDFDHRSHS
jgi:hypothetical protein